MYHPDSIDIDRQIRTFNIGLNSYSQGIVDAMKGLSEIAEKPSSTFLFSFGGVLLILAFFFRLQVAGIPVLALQPSEFITVVITSAVLILGGAAIRLYNSRNTQAEGREIRGAATKVLQDAVANALDIMKKDADAARAARDRAGQLEDQLESEYNKVIKVLGEQDQEISIEWNRVNDALTDYVTDNWWPDMIPPPEEIAPLPYDSVFAGKMLRALGSRIKDLPRRLKHLEKKPQAIRDDLDPAVVIPVIKDGRCDFCRPISPPQQISNVGGTVILVGIDYSTDPAKTGLAMASFVDGKIQVRHATPARTLDTLTSTVLDWLNESPAALLAIDALWIEAEPEFLSPTRLTSLIMCTY